jgi:hypothetical protein
MDIAAVRQRILQTIDQAKRAAADRRGRIDQASRDYANLLENVAVPLFRQIANALKAEGYNFSVFTPSGSVRLMSERNSTDFIEVVLDTSGDEPLVVGHASRGRGQRVVESERPIGDGPVADLSAEEILAFVLKELAPFVER